MFLLQPQPRKPALLQETHLINPSSPLLPGQGVINPQGLRQLCVGCVPVQMLPADWDLGNLQRGRLRLGDPPYWEPTLGSQVQMTGSELGFKDTEGGVIFLLYWDSQICLLPLWDQQNSGPQLPSPLQLPQGTPVPMPPYPPQSLATGGGLVLTPNFPVPSLFKRKAPVRPDHSRLISIFRS